MIAFVVVYLCFLAFLVVSAGKLPARVARHFGGEGHANGWMSRTFYLWFVACMPLVVAGITGLAGGLVRILPAWCVNIPRRDFWMAPERRPAFAAFLHRRLMWFACLMTGFFGALHALTINANMLTPPRLSMGGLLIVVMVFLTLLLLWTMSLLMRLAEVDKPLGGEIPDGTETASSARISRTAIVGACWAPLFLVIGLVILCLRGGPSGEQPSGPAWWQMMLAATLLPLGLFAPFGTTILGWIAVAQIRRSAGKLYGMGLAIFDGLFYPLLVLDGLIYWVWCLIRLTVRDMTGEELNLSLLLLLTIVTAAVVDWLIVRSVWRSVNPVVGATPARKSRIGVIIVVLLTAVLGVAALYAGYSYMIDRSLRSTITISGRVTDELSGRAIPQAIVMSGGSTRFTDAFGRYTLECRRLVPVIVASHSLYAAYAITNVDVRTRKGTNEFTIDFILRPLNPGQCPVPPAFMMRSKADVDKMERLFVQNADKACFGQMHERTLTSSFLFSDGIVADLLDLDTSYATNTYLSLKDPTAPTIERILTKGYDVLAIIGNDGSGVKFGNMAVKPVDDGAWTTVMPRDVLCAFASARFEKEGMLSEPSKTIDVAAKGPSYQMSGKITVSGFSESPEYGEGTLLFHTRQGTYGILQVLGTNAAPRGVTIRYKLVELPGVTRQAATGFLPEQTAMLGAVEIPNVMVGVDLDTGDTNIINLSALDDVCHGRCPSNVTAVLDAIVGPLTSLDLMGTHFNGKGDLGGLVGDLKLVLVSNECWSAASSRMIQSMLETSRSVLETDTMMPAFGSITISNDSTTVLPVTFAFSTAQGGFGMLQLVAFKEPNIIRTIVVPGALEIRFKRATTTMPPRADLLKDTHDYVKALTLLVRFNALVNALDESDTSRPKDRQQETLLLDQIKASLGAYASLVWNTEFALDPQVLTLIAEMRADIVAGKLSLADIVKRSDEEQQRFDQRFKPLETHFESLEAKLPRLVGCAIRQRIRFLRQSLAVKPSPLTAASGDITVVGVVNDAATGERIADATVECSQAKPSSTKSDKFGKYTLNVKRTGTTCRISYNALYLEYLGALTNLAMTTFAAVITQDLLLVQSNPIAWPAPPADSLLSSTQIASIETALHARAAEARFSPERQVTLAASWQRGKVTVGLLDIDTGYTTNIGYDGSFLDPRQPSVSLLVHGGFDLGSHIILQASAIYENGSVSNVFAEHAFLIRGDMACRDVDCMEWSGATPSSIIAAFNTLTNASEGYNVYVNGEMHRSYLQPLGKTLLFHTQQGTYGILQILSTNTTSRGITIRYKLVELPGVTRQSATGLGSVHETELGGVGMRDTSGTQPQVPGATPDQVLKNLFLSFAHYERAVSLKNARLAVKSMDDAIAAVERYNAVFSGTPYAITTSVVEAFHRARQASANGRLDSLQSVMGPVSNDWVCFEESIQKSRKDEFARLWQSRACAVSTAVLSTATCASVRSEFGDIVEQTLPMRLPAKPYPHVTVIDFDAGTFTEVSDWRTGSYASISRAAVDLCVGRDTNSTLWQCWDPHTNGLSLVELNAVLDWDMPAADLPVMLAELPTAFSPATADKPAHVEVGSFDMNGMIGKTFAFATAQGSTGMVHVFSMNNMLHVKFKTLQPVPTPAKP